MNTSRRISGTGTVTLLIIAGMLIGYVYQMSPAPLFGYMTADYGIVTSAGMPDFAALNLSLAIIFPFLIVSSLLGGVLEGRLGTATLFALALTLQALGMLAAFVAASYPVFLAGRALYGTGFGLAIPFMGSAIMKWYAPGRRERMNAANGQLPFLGTLAAFAGFVPLSEALGGAWRSALGCWGMVLLIVAWTWMLFAREDGDAPGRRIAAKGTEEGFFDLYGGLLKRREIRLTSLVFVCDFLAYTYLAAILPTLLGLAGEMDAASSGFWAAVAFPAVGFLGSAAGGAWITASGRRKPSLVAGQALKVVGICIASLGAAVSWKVILAGVMAFGLGNSVWMPSFYTIPMDLEGMTPNRVGAAFAMMTSFGFISGFIAPFAGGLIANTLIRSSGIADPVAAQIYGLRWSLFVFGVPNVLALLGGIRLRETGPLARTAA